eukprot:6424836-Prymnesium_polylepis.1
MLNTAFASMLMYHEERLDEHEMRMACMKLEATVRVTLRPPDARAAVVGWGRLILEKFTLDNQ